jgi:hypothetical protein
MAYLFKISSRLIVERHLPTIASDAYGIGFVEETHTLDLHEIIFSFVKNIVLGHAEKL